MPDQDTPPDVKESPPPKKRKPSPSPASALLTPDECAKACGETMTGPAPYRRVSYTPAHLAAECLHGWRDHAHHAGGPYTMTLDDYKAALDAASKTDKHGKAQPHKKALSEYCPHRKG